MTEILLHTKLGVPPLRSVAVPRTRLLEYSNETLVQDSEFLRKLTLVSAPAGYGKTTMVSEWLQRLGIPIAWLSLDESDNDPSRFLAYFIAAIQGFQSNFGESLRATFQSPQPPPVDVILTIMLNELAALPSLFILVLDDYHAINNLSIHQQISFLLDHLPSRMHLVLITREDPLIAISRLRARNQVLEIRQDDLRFTLPEISDFMSRVMQLDLTHDDIVALERRTEGWIAGLQLAALSLHGLRDKSNFIQAFTGSNRFILDYLIEEVFNRQPVDMRDFLLETAILDRLSGPLCCAVTGRSECRELLERLDQANMFIVPLDQSRTWYRYHRLFSELLRHQRHLSAQQIDEDILHHRASQWFEIEGYPAEAIHHSLLAHDWMKAAQLIGQVNERMFKQGEVVTLIGWLEKLPTELILSQPGLCMAYAWALLLTEKYAQAEPVLEQAGKLAPPESVLLGQVATAQAYLARSLGDNPRVIETSRLALSFLPENDFGSRGNLLMNLGLVYWHDGNLDDAELALDEAQEKAAGSGNLYAQLTSEIFLARTMASRGAIREAASKYPPIIQRGSQIPVIALAHFDLGSLNYEWNQLDQAEQYLQQGLELSRRTRNVEFQVAGLILQVYLLLARQEWSAASYIADQACTLGRDFSVQTRARCAACQALVALTMGDLQSTSRWLEQTSAKVDSHNFYRFLGLIQPRLLIAQGRKEAAAEQLCVCYETGSRAGWGYALIAIRVLQALAANTPESAHEFLTDAIRLAEPGGYIRTFVDAGMGLIPHLREVAQRGIATEYVGRLLTSMGTRSPVSNSTRSVLVEPLSEREVEVLKLVTAGLTNREIAGKLFISPGTAKTHIHNLCGKLGVRNRTEAANRARELGLV
ncbi:MAG: LuxR C-terminal-related transcriptional regulator [Anaerolineales bacterium]